MAIKPAVKKLDIDSIGNFVNALPLSRRDRKQANKVLDVFKALQQLNNTPARTNDKNVIEDIEFEEIK